MECRHQGRPLAAGRDIATAEVCDHGDARRLGQSRGVGELRRVTQLRTVTNRLSVQSDRGDVARAAMRRGQDRPDRGRTAIHQGVGRKRAAMDFVGAAALQRVQFSAQLGGECDVGPGHGAAGLDTEIRHDRIDAVDAGAGHQPHE